MLFSICCRIKQQRRHDFPTWLSTSRRPFTLPILRDVTQMSSDHIKRVSLLLAARLNLEACPDVFPRLARCKLLTPVSSNCSSQHNTTHTKRTLHWHDYYRVNSVKLYSFRWSSTTKHVSWLPRAKVVTVNNWRRVGSLSCQHEWAGQISPRATAKPTVLGCFLLYRFPLAAPSWTTSHVNFSLQLVVGTEFDLLNKSENLKCSQNSKIVSNICTLTLNDN